MESSYRIAARVYDYAALASELLIIIALVLSSVLALIALISSIPAWIYMRRLGVSDETPADKRVAILSNPVRRGAYRLYMTGKVIASLILLYIFLSVGVLLVGFILVAIVWTTKHWWIFPLWCAVGYGLYVFRNRHRALYGTCEVLVGAAAIYFSISQTANSDFARIISLSSGLYIIVRGLDNFDVGKIELADTLNSDVYIQVRLVWERWVKFSVASNTDFYNSLIKEREEIAARRNKSEDELKALGN